MIKGEITKDKIVETAKRLFKEYGYKQMRITELASELNISRGNLTYYFPTKDSIIEYLFQEYMDDINHWIESSDLPIEHFFSRKLYFLIMYDVNLFKDDNTMLFYKELIGSDVLKSIMLKMTREYIKILIDTENIRLNINELNYYTEGIVGAYQAMDLKYILNDYDTMPLYEYIAIKQYIRVQFLRIQQQSVYDSINFSVNIMKSYDHTDISLL